MPNSNTILVILGALSLIIIGFMITSSNKSIEEMDSQRNTTQNSQFYLEVDDFIKEMLDGKTQTFSVKDNPKAYGADWQLKVPNSWNILMGEKPNVIIKMGTKDNNPDVNMAIGAHKLPVPDGHVLTKNEIKDLFGDRSLISDLVNEKGKFVSGENIVIDGHNGYMAEVESTFKNIDNEIKMRSLNFFFIVDNVLFNLICNVSSSDLNDDLSIKMNLYKSFFKIVANSIIINKNLIQNNRDENIIIPIGFRKPNKDDITDETDWHVFREDFETPYYAHGDYNGDGIKDHVWQLININTEKVFQYCFLSTGNGYETILLKENGDIKGYTLIQTIPKGNLICNEEISRPLKFDGIGGAVYEVSDPWVYEYNIKSRSFEIYWDCPNGPE